MYFPARTALEQLTYTSLVHQTPRSRKQYHGVDYCLSTADTATDYRLTTIQQHCLISERASHCSNVTTPQASRAARETRQKKEVLARRASKQHAATSQKEKEGVSGDCSDVSDRLVSTSSEHAKIKVTPKTASRRRLLARQMRLKKKGSEGRVAGSREFVEDSESARVIRTPDRIGSGTGSATGVGGDVGAMATGDEARMSNSKSKRKHSSVVPSNSSIPIPSTGSVPVPTKSPRKAKRRSGSSEGRKKKDTHLKTLLGQAVVSALKKNAMPRSHPHFRTCYSKLFKLSKVFMEVS